MKTQLLFAFLLLPFALLAQNDTSVQSKTTKYCMMIPDQRNLSKKINIKLDTGEGFEILKDEKGKNRIFNSETEAINYLAGLGWDLVTTTMRKDMVIDPVICYIFKRTS